MSIKSNSKKNLFVFYLIHDHLFHYFLSCKIENYLKYNKNVFHNPKENTN